jgi:flagellar FliL protein
MAGKKKDAPKPGPAPEVEGAEGADGAPAKKKLAGKTLILFIVLPAILILGGGGAAAFMLLNKPAAEQHAELDEHGKPKKEKKDKHDKKEKKDKKEAGGHGEKGKDGKEAPGAAVVTEGEGVYYMALPELLVNVSTADGRPSNLKLKLTLEAADQDVVDAVEPQLPRVMDQFQSFLRELRVDDLSGSAGSYRLRLELLRRVNLAVAPAQVNAVLIEEMLVQ